MHLQHLRATKGVALITFEEKHGVSSEKYVDTVYFVLACKLWRRCAALIKVIAITIAAARL
jgi:hypothetical protein